MVRWHHKTSELVVVVVVAFDVYLVDVKLNPVPGYIHLSNEENK